jgi:hypothetical protein
VDAHYENVYEVLMCNSNKILESDFVDQLELYFNPKDRYFRIFTLFKKKTDSTPVLVVKKFDRETFMDNLNHPLHGKRTNLVPLGFLDDEFFRKSEIEFTDISVLMKIEAIPLTSQYI